MTGLYHHHHHSHQPAVVSVSANTPPHKMSGGIRRTVSSAAPSSGMGSVNGGSSNRPLVPGPNCVVKSLSSNTQVSAVRSSAASSHHISGKDPHKKLDRSFSEPAEKKNSSSSSQSQQQQQQQSLGPSSRYKTELCRSFAEVGSCKYGDKCQFAHGEEELRTVTRHPKFKTENCKSFHSTGFCPYGPRCHFIHNNDESKKSLINNLQGNGSSSGANNGPNTPTISQRMFEGSAMPAPIAVTGNHMNTISQPTPFAPTSPAAALVMNSNGNLVRPKALSLGSYSLGSSGEISPPSSQSGSPTSLNSFFTEDGFGLGTPFGPMNPRMSAVSAFQTPASNNTFSFSPDSAFVSFASGASSSGSTAGSGSSLSFGGNGVGTSTKCIFGGSQPTLASSRYSPEPTSADETANSVIFSLFGSGSPTRSPFAETPLERLQMNELMQCKSQLMYPSSPESPVDSVASEIEALKLGELPSTFSPISSSFSTSSLSTSSASPPNGIVDLDAFTLLSSAAPGGGGNGGVTNIPRLPTFTKFAANGINCTQLAHE